MSILGKFNQFMYTTRFSVFDLIWIVVIGTLAAEYSWWWYALMVPCTFISVKMERMFKNEG